MGSTGTRSLNRQPLVQSARFLSDPPHLWFCELSAGFDLHRFSKESENSGCVLSAWVLCRARDVQVTQMSIYANSFIRINDCLLSIDFCHYSLISSAVMVTSWGILRTLTSILRSLLTPDRARVAVLLILLALMTAQTMPVKQIVHLSIPDSHLWPHLWYHGPLAPLILRAWGMLTTWKRPSWLERRVARLSCGEIDGADGWRAAG